MQTFFHACENETANRMSVSQEFECERALVFFFSSAFAAILRQFVSFGFGTFVYVCWDVVGAVAIRFKQCK